MNILLVCCDYSLSGGSEKVAFRLYKELKNQINIKIISVYSQNGNSSFDDSEVEYLIKEKGSFKKHAFKAIRLLSDAAIRFETDILISIGVSASYYVCEVGRRKHIKTIVCEHSNISNKYYNDLVQMFSRIYSVRNCDKFITLTQEDMLNYCNRFPKFTNKFDYIYNWAEVVKGDSKYNYNINSKKIITLSRIDRVKGLEYSLKIFEKIHTKYPDWRWEVYGVGDKDYLEELECYIRENNIKGFYFMGFCADIDSVLKQASIYACTSKYEGLPLSFLEAKSYGIPIISFNCKTGPKEIIVDEKDGYLVKVGDIDSFANKLSFLITNELTRKEMSENSLLNIGKFDKKSIINKWITIFNDIL